MYAFETASNSSSPRKSPLIIMTPNQSIYNGNVSLKCIQRSTTEYQYRIVICFLMLYVSILPYKQYEIVHNKIRKN